MNPPNDPLSDALRGWVVRPPRDPGFRSAVWLRIEDRGADSWPRYLRAHAVAWTAAAFVLVGAAAYAGRMTAQVRLKADRETLVRTYLVDLDPRAQAALRP